MLIKSLLLSALVLIAAAKAEVMTMEDKLISMAMMVKYKDYGLMDFSQGDYLALLDMALVEGYSPSSRLLAELADQPDLLQQTQARVQAHQ